MSNDLSNAHPGKWTAFAGKTSVGRVNQPEVESLQDWGTAHQGEVFNVMLKQHAINPLFVLDEVDKSNSDVKSNPLGPLYQLLEEETAKEFVDEFAGVPINASLITWLITANDESRIPAALLSRMRVFHIQPHNAQQMVAVVEKQYPADNLNFPCKPVPAADPSQTL